MIKVKKQIMVTVYENDVELEHINNFIKKISSILGDLEFSCEIGYTNTEIFKLEYHSLYFKRCLIEIIFKSHYYISDFYINSNIIHPDQSKEIIEIIKEFNKKGSNLNG